MLKGLVQPLEYLNLQDCRLDSTDVEFINTPCFLKNLLFCKDLNLSMNDFSQIHSTIFDIIANCAQLNCLSISHCQIPIDLICQNLVFRIFLNQSSSALSTIETKKFSKLKVVCIQPFVPPKMNEIIDILHAFSLITSLQKLLFLPSLYAFPGKF